MFHLLILLFPAPFFKYILLIMILQLSHFILLFIPLCPIPPFLSSFPHLSSCPWVIHISSLASPFLILFLTSPCLFCTYHLCYLFPVPFLPLSPSHCPADNPPCDFHFCSCSSCLLCCFFQVCSLSMMLAVGLQYMAFLNI